MRKTLMLIAIMTMPRLFAFEVTQDLYLKMAKQAIYEARDSGELGGKSLNKVLSGVLERAGLVLRCRNENLDVITSHQCVFEITDGSFNPTPIAVKTYRAPEGSGGWSRAGDIAIGYAGKQIVDRVSERVLDIAEEQTKREFARRERQIENERQANAERNRMEREARMRREAFYNDNCEYSTPSFRGGDC